MKLFSKEEKPKKKHISKAKKEKLRLKEIPVAIRDVSDDLLIYMILSRGNKKLLYIT